MKPRIEVEDVGKKYCRSLKRSMRYGLADVGRDLLGLPSRAEHLRPDEFWVFRAGTFKVEPGECLGVIGPNGAGKSTLLKLVAGIYPPDAGRIRTSGRVGSLIEVGAGFHPLLSGRENVYINGTILGMSTREIDQKFDEIVAFSGIENFIDSPVKHYSSGMFVRLGFAVAAHASPDVLLVDEALAVGDLAFNIKCINRIAELRRNGTGILFVSHNELQVRLAASRCLLVHGGQLKEFTEIDQAYLAYQSVLKSPEIHDEYHEVNGPEQDVYISSLEIKGADGELQVQTGSSLRVVVKCRSVQQFQDAELELRIWASDGQHISTLNSARNKLKICLPRGESVVEIEIHTIPLKPGRYRIAGGFISQGDILCWSGNLAWMDVYAPEDTTIDAGIIMLDPVFRFFEE